MEVVAKEDKLICRLVKDWFEWGPGHENYKAWPSHYHLWRMENMARVRDLYRAERCPGCNGCFGTIAEELETNLIYQGESKQYEAKIARHWLDN